LRQISETAKPGCGPRSSLPIFRAVTAFLRGATDSKVLLGPEFRLAHLDVRQSQGKSAVVQGTSEFALREEPCKLSMSYGQQSNLQKYSAAAIPQRFVLLPVPIICSSREA